MKKILLLIAVLLPSFLAYSQEADTSGCFAEMSVITRLDLNPSFAAENSSFDLGNSSIFTHFQGAFSEHISWTMINQWYEAGTPFADAFRKLGRSDDSNFLDYLFADFNFGSWTFTLGKQMIDTGGIEFQDYDWDLFANFTTPFGDNMVCSQWGGKIAWTTPSQNSTLSLQMLASPYGQRPLSSGMWVYSVQWMGDYGWFHPIWSLSAYNNEDSSYELFYSFGQTIDLSESLSLDADYFHGPDFSDESPISHMAKLRLNYSPTESFSAALNGIYVQNPLCEYWSIGALAKYFPLKDSTDLRLHAQISYNTLLRELYLGVGATYNLSFRFGK